MTSPSSRPGLGFRASCLLLCRAFLVVRVFVEVFAVSVLKHLEPSFSTTMNHALSLSRSTIVQDPKRQSCPFLLPYSDGSMETQMEARLRSADVVYVAGASHLENFVFLLQEVRPASCAVRRPTKSGAEARQVLEEHGTLMVACKWANLLRALLCKKAKRRKVLWVHLLDARRTCIFCTPVGRGCMDMRRLQTPKRSKVLFCCAAMGRDPRRRQQLRIS